MNLGGAPGKFLTVSILSIDITFLISYLLRRIPIVSRVV